MKQVPDTYVRTQEGWRSFVTGRTLPAGPPPIAHGRLITPDIVGITGAGVGEGDLVDQGFITYSTPGEVIAGKRFTSGVAIAADNVTIRGCVFASTGANAINLNIQFGVNGTIVEFNTFAPGPGHSAYEGIVNSGAGTIIRRNDISRCENSITTAADNVTIEENYLHDPSDVEAEDGHKDLIEIFGGDTINIRRNRIVMGGDETAPINCAPFGGPARASDLNIEDNYIGGGIYHVLIDYQGTTGDIFRTRVLRNDMDGHTFPGYTRYWALANSDSRPVVETEAALAADPRGILWPTSGNDVNRWVDCADLIPDRTGQIVIP